MGSTTIEAPSEQAQQEAADALAAEQARVDAGGELAPELDPPETSDRSYDDLSDLNDEQRLIAGECASRDDLEEWVDEARRQNAAELGEKIPPAPDPEPDTEDLAAEVEEAHAAATLHEGDDEEDESGGAPTYQHEPGTAAEQLAGGAPMQQTISGDEERYPTATDDAGDDAGAAMILRGDGQLGFSGIGGKQPDKATLVLTGGKFGIEEGQLKKGTDRVVIVTGRVKGISFDDTLDSSTRDATTSSRNHKAQIIGAKLIPHQGYRVAVVPVDTPTLDGELKL